MKHSTLLAFLTTISIAFTALALQAKKTEYFAQTNNENIICSMTRLTKSEATRLCKKEMLRFEKKATRPWLYISPGITFPKNCIPLKVKITNNSPDNIYFPGRRYLGNNTMELDSPYDLKHAFLQLGLAYLPTIGGILTGKFVSSKIKDSLAGVIIFPSFFFLGILITHMELDKLGSFYEQAPSKLFFKESSFKRYTCKIHAGETFEDVIFLDRTKINEVFFKQAKFIYLRENLKEWDPKTMHIIPNDGYAYYYDQEVLDTRDIEDHFLLEGFLILKKPLTTIRLNKKSTFYLNGAIYFEEGCETELESGTVISPDETFFWDSFI